MGQSRKCSEQALSRKRSLRQGRFSCDYLPDAPVSRDMLPGQHLVPGSAGAGNRQEEMPAETPQAREGWDVVATDFPSELTECQALPFLSKRALSALGLG